MAKTFSFGTSGWTEEELKALDEMAKDTDRSKFLRGLVRKEEAERQEAKERNRLYAGVRAKQTLTPPPTPPQKMERGVVRKTVK